ncbi:hypothetical protein NOK12_01350 [Nocardioides sp. OK12]|uniref:hypothetical protein n=1 Tax=Nocardioides sp. OK12 TaxID=2758661 RepID=UPI0021C3B889|nr:hypothetical protein [Nocardioides sp. OK12]GHJ57616.1 hypothetical protein NOK12_01350 [Nocardioides sp. OK12]
MNSSGIKRGLAGSAITALAITGLPFLATSASAIPLADQATTPGDVELYTPDGTASTKNDGVESSIHLVANAAANVQQVRFEYNTNPAATAATAGWTTIATVSRDAGAFDTEWTPPPALFNTQVAFRAVGLAAGQAETDVDEINNSVTISPTAESVDIAYAGGAEVGVFDQPYAASAGRTVTSEELLGAVSGTTSDLSADPALTVESPGLGAPNDEDVAGPVAPGASSRTYSAPVDFTGYNFAPATPPAADQALIVAEAGGDDAEAVELYEQTISGVTVTADDNTVIPGGNSDVTVLVSDQDGAPVVGAEVVSQDGLGTKFTNSQGEAVFNADPAGESQTFSFYVNTNENYAYENGTDFRRTVTISEEAQQPTSIVAASNDGAAFDEDEYSAGDISVTVTDQNDEGISGAIVNYTWTFKAFPTTATPNPVAVTTSGATTATDSDGEATVPLPTGYQAQEGTYVLNYYLNQDGTPGQGAGDLSGSPLTVKSGQANLVLDERDPAPAGTTATYTGSLKLDDGTALAGRDVQFTYTRNGAGDDVVIAPQADQPEGTTRVSTTVAEDTTDADGNISVALFDPAVAGSPESELDGELDATTLNTDDIGDADEDSNTVDVDFVTDEVDGTAVVKITENTATGKPGEVTSGTVKVTVDDPDTTAVENDPAANVLVTLTVDGDAFFTTMGGEPADPEEGDQAGDIVDRGQTITVVTDSTGNATYYIGIKGSDDFDDDGEATVNVTATVDGQSDTEDYDFSSENPLNGGDVIIELASDKFQDSSVLPKLPLSDTAAYDVQATDQFGNLVKNVEVDIDIDGVGDADPISVRTDFNDNVEFAVDSNVAGDSMPVGTWDAPVNEYNDLGVVVPDSEDIEGEGPEVEFYAVDFANSTFTLAQQGPETVPVGTTVIMDYTAVDQNGEPIEFSVDFFRTGPDDFQDGDPNNPTPVATGEDGMATYVFSGAAEGTATVTAIGYVGATVVPASQATDTVSFGEDQGPEPVVVEAIISADSNGPKKDVVRFQVDDEAEGATVKLFKIRGKKSEGNKRLVQVREDIVPEGGTLTFKVADRNGNKKTRFIAKVSATEISQKAKSNTQKPR